MSFLGLGVTEMMQYLNAVATKRFINGFVSFRLSLNPFYWINTETRNIHILVAR
jgi:hypothetical protein